MLRFGSNCWKSDVAAWAVDPAHAKTIEKKRGDPALRAVLHIEALPHSTLNPVWPARRALPFPQGGKEGIGAIPGTRTQRRPVPIAGDANLPPKPHHAPMSPSFLSSGFSTGTFFSAGLPAFGFDDFADNLVARTAAEAVVAASQFNICIADAASEQADEGNARRSWWHGSVSQPYLPIFKMY